MTDFLTRLKAAEAALVELERERDSLRPNHPDDVVAMARVKARIGHAKREFYRLARSVAPEILALEDLASLRQGAAVSGAKVVYMQGSNEPEWGTTYLLAEVWRCGDEICDCSAAQISRIVPSLDAGRPWIRRERAWEGPFYSGLVGDEPGAAERDLEAHLAELEATGVVIVRKVQP